MAREGVWALDGICLMVGNLVNVQEYGEKLAKWMSGLEACPYFEVSLP